MGDDANNFLKQEAINSSWAATNLHLHVQRFVSYPTPSCRHNDSRVWATSSESASEISRFLRGNNGNLAPFTVDVCVFFQRLACQNIAPQPDLLEIRLARFTR